MINWKKTILGGCVLAALAGLLIWDIARNRQAEETRAAAARMLPAPIGSVTAINIVNQAALIALERADPAKGNEGWRIVKPIATGADPETMASLLEYLGKQEKLGAQPANEKEMVAYGLAQPALRAEIKMTDKPDFKLLLGENAPVGGEVYARTDGSSDFFTVAGPLRDQLRRPLYDYRDKRLVTLDPSQVTNIALTSKGETIETVKSAGKWKLTRPITAEADNERIEELLREIHMTRAVDFVDTATLRSAEAGFFGLDVPTVVASLGTGVKPEASPEAPEENSTLLVGLRSFGEEHPTYYAGRKGQDQVFTIPQGLYEKLQPTVSDLRAKEIFTFTIEQVTHLSLRFGSSLTRLKKNAMGQWEFEEGSPAGIDQTFIHNVIVQLLKIRVAEYLNVQPLPEQSGIDDPTLVIILSDETGQRKEGLETGRPVEGKDRTYARRLGDAEVFTIEGDQPAKFFLLRDDFEDKALYAFVPKNVGGIEVEESGRVWTFQRQQDSWLVRPRGSPEAFQIKTINVERFIEVMRSLRWKRRLDPNDPEEAKQIQAHGLLSSTRVIRLLDEQGNELAKLAEGENDQLRVYIKRGEADYFALDKLVYATLVEAMKPLFSPQ